MDPITFGFIDEIQKIADEKVSLFGQEIEGPVVGKVRRRIAGFLRQSARKGSRLAGAGRRVFHEIHKLKHQRPVRMEDMPEDVKALAKQSKARVFEEGAKSPIKKVQDAATLGSIGLSELGRRLGEKGRRGAAAAATAGSVAASAARDTSRAMPHGTIKDAIESSFLGGAPKPKVVVSGPAKKRLQVLRHELGHVTGLPQKHPELHKALMSARVYGPGAAGVAKTLGQGGLAKGIHGAAQAATIGEEARAHIPALKQVGRDIKKGKIWEAIKGVKSPVMGLGSYLYGAWRGHKALSKPITKKAQDAAIPTGVPMGAPMMQLPPEYIEQMQAQFGEYEQPSMLSQLAMPAALVGGGLGIGAAATQWPKIKGMAGSALGAGKDKLMNLFKGGMEIPFLLAFADELQKVAKKKMPHFTEQDRPEGVKKVYRALAHRSAKAEEMRKRYGKNWKEVAARIAARQGKRGKQKQGPPYKGPLGG